MKKREFIVPTIEVVKFEVEDVICTSGDVGDGEVDLFVMDQDKDTCI